MGKKKTDGAKGVEKKVDGYVVAAGHAYTSGGVLYDEGDVITAAAFANEDDFKAEIASKGIVSADIDAPVDDEKDGDDDSEKDAGATDPTNDTDNTGGNE